LKESEAIGTPRMLIIGVISKDPIIPLRSSKETEEIGIEMIKNISPSPK
jgi:hypothetical protein